LPSEQRTLVTNEQIGKMLEKSNDIRSVLNEIDMYYYASGGEGMEIGNSVATKLNQNLYDYVNETYKPGLGINKIEDMISEGKMLNYLLHENLITELHKNRKDTRTIKNRKKLLNVFTSILDIYTTTENHENVIAMFLKPFSINHYINEFERKTSEIELSDFRFSHILTQNATRAAYTKRKSLFRMRYNISIVPILKFFVDNEQNKDIQNVKEDILKKNYMLNNKEPAKNG
jgi:hypothetical protein